MGSWNVKCAVSNISIRSGTDVALVFIEKGKYDTYDKEYSPICLPIYGKYNDYGGIEDIIKNDNTALIEQTYGQDINTLANLICRNSYVDVKGRGEGYIIENGSNLDKELDSVNHCWIIKDIYDSMSARYDIGKSYRNHLSYGNESILNQLGFTFVKKDDTKTRYNKLYSNGTIELYSDGTWLENSVYSNEHLVDLGIDITPIKDLEYTNSMLDLARNSIEKIKKDKQDYNEMLRKIQPDIDIELISKAIENEYEYKDSVRFLFPFDRYSENSLVKAYNKYFVDNTNLDKEIIKFYNFRASIGDCNISLKPYDKCGSQCGEYKAHQYWLELFCKVNNSMIYNDED
jgi:hypothetical protein